MEPVQDLVQDDTSTTDSDGHNRPHAFTNRIKLRRRSAFRMRYPMQRIRSTPSEDTTVEPTIDRERPNTIGTCASTPERLDSNGNNRILNEWLKAHMNMFKQMNGKKTKKQIHDVPDQHRQYFENKSNTNNRIMDKTHEPVDDDHGDVNAIAKTSECTKVKDNVGNKINCKDKNCSSNLAPSITASESGTCDQNNSENNKYTAEQKKELYKRKHRGCSDFFLQRRRNALKIKRPRILKSDSNFYSEEPFDLKDLTNFLRGAQFELSISRKLTYSRLSVSYSRNRPLTPQVVSPITPSIIYDDVFDSDDSPYATVACAHGVTIDNPYSVMACAAKVSQTRLTILRDTSDMPTKSPRTLLSQDQAISDTESYVSVRGIRSNNRVFSFEDITESDTDTMSIVSVRGAGYGHAFSDHASIHSSDVSSMNSCSSKNMSDSDSYVSVHGKSFRKPVFSDTSSRSSTSDSVYPRSSHSSYPSLRRSLSSSTTFSECSVYSSSRNPSQSSCTSSDETVIDIGEADSVFWDEECSRAIGVDEEFTVSNNNSSGEINIRGIYDNGSCILLYVSNNLSRIWNSSSAVENSPPGTRQLLDESRSPEEWQSLTENELSPDLACRLPDIGSDDTKDMSSPTKRSCNFTIENISLFDNNFNLHCAISSKKLLSRGQ